MIVSLMDAQDYRRSPDEWRGIVDSLKARLDSAHQEIFKLHEAMADPIVNMANYVEPSTVTFSTLEGVRIQVPPFQYIMRPEALDAIKRTRDHIPYIISNASRRMAGMLTDTVLAKLKVEL